MGHIDIKYMSLDILSTPSPAETQCGVEDLKHLV